MEVNSNRLRNMRKDRLCSLDEWSRGIQGPLRSQWKEKVGALFGKQPGARAVATRPDGKGAENGRRTEMKGFRGATGPEHQEDGEG